MAPVGAFEALRLLLVAGLGVVVVGAAVEVVDDDVADDLEGATSTGSSTAGAGGSRGAAGEWCALERVRTILVCSNCWWELNRELSFHATLLDRFLSFHVDRLAQQV